MPNIQPAQKTFHYVVTPSSGSFDVEIDVAKDLSAINRRLYRQGMQYLISDVKIATGKGLVVTSVSTAGDTWMCHNAWKKGFNMWKKQRAMAQDDLPGLSGKWADFKVQLWNASSTTLTPLAGSESTAPDEWLLSQVFWDDDGTERSPTFCLVGSTAPNTKIGLIQEYHISRVRPAANEPAVDADASDSIYAKMLPMQDELSDALIDDIEGDNDAPPYDMDEMFGGDTLGDEPCVQDISFASEFASSSTGPFTAECGLIRIQGTSKLTSTFPRAASGSGAYDDVHYLSEDLDESIVIQVTIAPGPYRGVMATPMGQ